MMAYNAFPPTRAAATPTSGGSLVPLDWGPAKATHPSKTGTHVTTQHPTGTSVTAAHRSLAATGPGRLPWAALALTGAAAALATVRRRPRRSDVGA
jgi:hypothetical protein